MTDLWNSMPAEVQGAALAIAGTILATFLQLGSAGAARRAQTVRDLRSMVQRCAIAIQTYGALSYQFLDMHQKRQQYAFRDEALEAVGKLINEWHPKADANTMELMGCGEGRLSSVAHDLHHALAAFHQKYAYTALYHNELRLETLEIDRKELFEPVNILLNMVEPRWWERVWRIRSESSAKRTLAKLRQKRGIGGHHEGFEASGAPSER